MEITKLPTDNLYKFIALTGITLVILSIAAPYALIGDAVREQIEIYGGQEIAMIELKYIEEDIREAIEKNKGTLPSEERLRLFKQLRDAKVEGEKASTRLKQFGYLRERTLHIKRWAVFGGLCGFGMSLAGFVLWYFRLQRYQDAVLRKQAMGENASA